MNVCIARRYGLGRTHLQAVMRTLIHSIVFLNLFYFEYEIRAAIGSGCCDLSTLRNAFLALGMLFPC